MGDNERTHADMRIEFSYQAVADIQGTIRAIDMKLQILMAILIVPLPSLGGLSDGARALVSLAGSQHELLTRIAACALGVLFLLSWVLSFLSTLRGLAAIHNPHQHVRAAPLPEGRFYSGDLFYTGLVDVFFNRSSLQSTQDLDAYVASQPSSFEAIQRELAYERMKLSYVRDMKMCRQKWAFRFCLLWVLSTWVIWSFGLIP